LEFVPYLVPLNSTYVNISDLFYPVQDCKYSRQWYA